MTSDEKSFEENKEQENKSQDTSEKKEIKTQKEPSTQKAKATNLKKKQGNPKENGPEKDFEMKYNEDMPESEVFGTKVRLMNNGKTFEINEAEILEKNNDQQDNMSLGSNFSLTLPYKNQNKTHNQSKNSNDIASQTNFSQFKTDKDMLNFQITEDNRSIYPKSHNASQLTTGINENNPYRNSVNSTRRSHLEPRMNDSVLSQNDSYFIDRSWPKHFSNMRMTATSQFGVPSQNDSYLVNRSHLSQIPTRDHESIEKNIRRGRSGSKFGARIDSGVVGRFGSIKKTARDNLLAKETEGLVFPRIKRGMSGSRGPNKDDRLKRSYQRNLLDSTSFFFVKETRRNRQENSRELRKQILENQRKKKRKEMEKRAFDRKMDEKIKKGKKFEIF